MKIQLRLFGALRDCHPNESMELQLNQCARIGELRQRLRELWQQAGNTRGVGLLAVSAFASDSEILRDHQPLPDDGRLALLPPVSGG